MSALTQLIDKGGHHLTAPTRPAQAASRLTMAQASEMCWGAATFALFLILGPFSAVAVVCSLGSLARNQEGKMEPRAAH